MPPDTNYPAADEADAAAPSIDETETEDNPQEKSDEPQQSTALVPKALWPNCKPGDKMTFEVVQSYSDEIEIRPQKKSKEQGSIEGVHEKMNALAE